MGRILIAPPELIMFANSMVEWSGRLLEGAMRWGFAGWELSQ
jgi:hypothetical protein